MTTGEEKRGDWYVVQALSGQETKACESILKRLAPEEMEELIFDARVPTEKVSEVRQGKKRTVDRKLFPSYILLQARLFDLDRKINHRVWDYVKDTPGVIGFLGGERPQALSDQEANDILNQQAATEEQAKPKIEFELGELVKICDGPFENFEGKIEGVDQEHLKLRLSVNIFNRITPVEVGYWQVERQES